MSGDGQVVIPGPLVDTDAELLEIMFVYGRDAIRAGFRMQNPISSTAVVMGNSVCSQISGKPYLQKCGPYKLDHYTAPIWLLERNQDISNLPPR